MLLVVEHKNNDDSFPPKPAETPSAMLPLPDALFAALVVCPCVVSYWRAVWGLMDLYLGGLGGLGGGLVSVGIGMGGHVVFALLQGVLQRRLHPDRNRLVFYAVSRLYTTCFAFVCVNGWRGPWECLNFHSRSDPVVLGATTVIGIVALMALRALRNVTAPPFVVVRDDVDGYFEVTTMFKIQMKDKITLYLLDCLFSVVVVGTLVVFVWRGLWLLLDMLLYPENEELSSWSSLALGYIIVAFLLTLQPFLKYVCGKLNGSAKLLFADVVIVSALFGTVNVWRGIWNLLPIYFFTADTELCSWITHWVTVVFLVLCGCSNSLLVRGVDVDAEGSGGDCVNFQIRFFRPVYDKTKSGKWKPSEVRQKDEVTHDPNHCVTIATIS